ncbi:uncharacterized protein J4E78_009630 [Alternaria triticimaculans]|uniref:uncharacterized protein n=1 Tax=Alternaria triticimaculans TaxID=297637 RepID=UPI0020C543E9|nr:uncharacterized protein J4E78_009630 [Alternaria triticimaculans]KAI4644047.1 hypothetical protein J4E78_009630 [Alternaria triticimaculans]
METAGSMENVKEDGWSDSSQESSSVSDITSNEDLVVPGAASVTLAADFSADAVYDHLRRQLEQSGVLPRNWKVHSDTIDTSKDDSSVSSKIALPYPALFPQIATSVVQGGVKSWRDSDHKFLRLNLPVGLDNQYFVASLVTQLVASQTDGRLTPVVLRQDGAGVGATERLLMSLCYHILSDRTADWEFPELLGELKVSFFGLNVGWREDLMWALLHRLLTQGGNLPRLLVLSLPFESSSAQNSLLADLERLLDLMDNTDRRIKLLLLVGHTIQNDIVKTRNTFMEECQTMEIDILESSTQQAFQADLQSHFTTRFAARPSLQEDGDEMISTIMQHGLDPLSAISTLDAMSNRPWLFLPRSEVKSALVHDTPSIVARIPEADRSIIAQILSILRYCARPLTLRELSEALTAGDESALAPSEGKVAWDITYGLSQSLAGIVRVEDDLVRLLPACPADSAGQQRLSLDDAAGWLDLGPAAEMRLALLCLRCISTSSTVIESVKAGDEDAIDKKMPFLNYAASFWYYHYIRAVENGGANNKVAKLRFYEPIIINTWLGLQGSFYSSSLMALSEENPNELDELSPFAIAEEFGIRLSDAMTVVDLVECQLLTVKRDVHGARGFLLGDEKSWKDVSPAKDRLNKAFSHCSPTSLVSGSVYLPESAFNLLRADPDVVRKNAMSLLNTAVRQANSELVKACLPHVTVDIKLLSLLPYDSVSLGPGWTTIVEALPPAELELLKDGTASPIAKEILGGAIRHGQHHFVDFLMHCDFCFPQPDFVQLLYVATKAGQRSTVKRLLESHKSTSLVCESSVDTALHCASACGFTEIAELLLARGASVSAKESTQDTPLHLAANYGHLEVLRSLIEANKTAVRSHISNVSTEGVENPSNEGVEMASDSETSGNVPAPPPATIDALEMQNESRSIPLEVAIRSGDEAVVALLLDHTPRAMVLEREPLHIASRCENLDVLRLVMQYGGINLDRRTDSGWYALEIACSMERLEVARILLEHGATAWPPDTETYDYPFSRLSYSENTPEVTKLAELLTNGNNRPAKSVLTSMLLYMAGQPNEVLIATLLDAGADRDATDAWERTAAHVSAMNGNESVLRVLLMRGAETSTMDKDGQSPLAEATAIAHLGCMRLLLQRGDRLSRKTAEATLLKMMRTENKEILEALKMMLERHEELRGAEVLCECFHAALRQNNGEVVSLLLDYGANEIYTARKGTFGSAIHECAYYGNVKMARDLLDHKSAVRGTTVNHLAGQYWTPLIAAVSWRYPKSPQNSKGKALRQRRLLRQMNMVELLINRGGKPKWTGGRFGTMLNAAVANGEPDLVRYLIDKVGFKVDEVDDEGRSAAHVGCSSLNGRESIHTLNVLPKELLWTADNYKRLPLHFACSGQNRGILESLFYHNLTAEQVNLADEDGWTSLHWACRQWDVSIIRRLISCGANTDSLTKDRQTPWDVAVFHDNVEFASALGRDESEADEVDIVDHEVKRWSLASLLCIRNEIHVSAMP